MDKNILRNSMTTTLITHIYNEEYLLPNWLEHHKPFFDNLVVIDYDSTDNSVEICRNIWKNCKIIKSRNKYFDAVEIDKEVMDIEMNIDGIKMVLNTTEFLFTNLDIKSCFNKTKSFAVYPFAPVSLNDNIHFTDNKDLFKSMMTDDIRFPIDINRGYRHLHNFKHGNYGLGRHSTYNPVENTMDIFIIWLGYYPMNERMMKRKLQIKTKMSEHDIKNRLGFQHLYDTEKIINIKNSLFYEGSPLYLINNRLYEIIHKIYN